MALTAADKAWLREMVQQEIAAQLSGWAVTATQLGGYDGATPVLDEEAGGRLTKNRTCIGFKR